MEKKYDDWKKEVNNHPSVIKHGDALVSVEELKKTRRWRIFRDSMILVLFLSVILLVSVYIFYPESYRDIVNVAHVCDPVVNLTTIGGNINNSCVCDVVCESPNFPSTLRLIVENSS